MHQFLSKFFELLAARLGLAFLSMTCIFLAPNFFQVQELALIFSSLGILGFLFQPLASSLADQIVIKNKRKLPTKLILGLGFGLSLLAVALLVNLNSSEEPALLLFSYWCFVVFSLIAAFFRLKQKNLIALAAVTPFMLPLILVLRIVMPTQSLTTIFLEVSLIYIFVALLVNYRLKHLINPLFSDGQAGNTNFEFFKYFLICFGGPIFSMLDIIISAYNLSPEEIVFQRLAIAISALLFIGKNASSFILPGIVAKMNKNEIRKFKLPAILTGQLCFAIGFICILIIMVLDIFELESIEIIKKYETSFLIIILANFTLGFLGPFVVIATKKGLENWLIVGFVGLAFAKLLLMNLFMNNIFEYSLLLLFLNLLFVGFMWFLVIREKEVTQ